MTANPTYACPSCGSEDLEMSSDDDEWACLQCNCEWPGEVARGEQEVSMETMAVRDHDSTYTLYEIWFVDDPDTGNVIKVRSGLSRTEAEEETPNVLDEPPESRLLG